MRDSFKDRKIRLELLNIKLGNHKPFLNKEKKKRELLQKWQKLIRPCKLLESMRRRKMLLLLKFWECKKDHKKSKQSKKNSKEKWERSNKENLKREDQFKLCSKIVSKEGRWNNDKYLNQLELKSREELKRQDLREELFNNMNRIEAKKGLSRINRFKEVLTKLSRWEGNIRIGLSNRLLLMKLLVLPEKLDSKVKWEKLPEKFNSSMLKDLLLKDNKLDRVFKVSKIERINTNDKPKEP